MNAFCSVMNMPPPKKTMYSKLLRNISYDVSKPANSSMTETDPHEICKMGHAKITVSDNNGS